MDRDLVLNERKAWVEQESDHAKSIYLRKRARAGDFIPTELMLLAKGHDHLQHLSISILYFSFETTVSTACDVPQKTVTYDENNLDDHVLWHPNWENRCMKCATSLLGHFLCGKELTFGSSESFEEFWESVPDFWKERYGYIKSEKSKDRWSIQRRGVYWEKIDKRTTRKSLFLFGQKIGRLR